MGTGNPFEVHVFRNANLLGEHMPLHSCSIDDLDRRYKTNKPGLYSENTKQEILQKTIKSVNGKKSIRDLTSNLTDHDIPARLISAVYLSHVRRASGENPIVD